MVVNIVLNLIFMNTPLRHGGLALATSCAALVNIALLIRWLGVDLHGIVDRPLRRLFLESLLLSAIMGVACGAGWLWLAPRFGAAAWPLRALMMLSLVALGVALFALGAKILRIREMDEAWRVFTRRRAAQSNSDKS